MKAALFIPCFIDAIYPEVGIATLELLERLGVEVEYPVNQTCCGQPMANEGDQKDSASAEENFVKNFAGYDYIVAPSGSCVSHIRHYFDAIEQSAAVTKIRKVTYELVEFITDVLKVSEFPWAEFNNCITIHNSCSAIRGLHIAKPSEVMGKDFNKTADLLRNVKGVEITAIDRPDECCGFGGTFCVTDEAVAASMGSDKNSDIVRHGAKYVVSTDMSCLLHLQGISEKNNMGLQFLHVAQILNNGPFAWSSAEKKVLETKS